MSAGYSARTLVQKLGIRKGDAIAIVDAPAGYEGTLGELPEDVKVSSAAKGELDFIQLFARTRERLEVELPRLKEKLRRDGMLWVSWPKRSSKLETDLDDSAVREVGLANGLVDVKVCAIDESWSALKFVRRSRDRRGSSIGA
jgi:hypothetical protein